MAISDTQKEYIVGLVVGLFNAAPGANYLRELSNAIEAGTSFEDLADFLVSTPQFQQDILKGNVTVSNQVSVLLNNFGLAPGNTDPASPDAQAEQFFTDRLNAGADIGDVVIEAGLYLLGSPAAAFQDTANLFKNKILVAGIYSRENSDDSVADLQAVLAGVTATGPANEADAIAYLESIGKGSNPGQTFMLTVNQDNIVGTVGNDTIIAGAAQDGSGSLINTLQSVDVIDGGTGTDILKFTDADGSTVTPSMTNVEIVEARFTDSGDLDLSNSDGVTEIRVLSSTDSGNVSGIGAVENFVIGNDKAGNSIDFNDGTATALNITFNNYGNTDPDNLNQGGVWFNDNNAVSATVNINNSNVALHFHGDLTKFKSMTVNAAGTNIFDTTDESDEFIETLTVTGAGSVDFDGNDWEALKTLSADTATGHLTNIHVDDTATSVALGSGNDEITYDAAPVATAVVNLGAGDDKITLSAAPAAGATIAGGDGKDTISLLTAGWETIAGFSDTNRAKISSFEVLSISDALADTKTYDLSKLSGLTDFVAESGVVTAGTATVALASNSTVTIAGDLVTNDGTLVVNVKDAATGENDVLNLVIAGDDSVGDATVVVEAEGVETVNLDITGDDDEDINTYSLDLTNDELVTLNIAGNDIAEFSAAGTMEDLATIDASDNTAGVIIDVSALAQKVEITGTVEDDTFTVGDNAEVTGNGGNDTFVINAPTGGQKYSTILDANKDDVLDFSIITADSFTTSKITLAGTAVFQDYLDAGANKTAGDISWFEWSGDTFVVLDNNGAATFQNGVDVVVKLTGAVDLSQAVFNDGLDTLTLA